MPGIDLGLGVAGAAGGMADSFQAILARRLEEELKRRALDIQQQQANQQGQQISQQGQYWQEQAASMKAQREAQAAKAQQDVQERQLGLMTPGQDVPAGVNVPPQLMQSQPAEMPGEGPLTAPGQGPTTARPRVYTGTPGQQQVMDQQGMIRTLLSDANTPPELKKFIMTKTGLGKEGQGVSYGDFVPKPIPRDPLADHAANRRFDLAHPTPTPESNTQPQIFYDAQNKPHAIQFMHGQTNEIPLPPNLTGKTGLSSVTANRADSAQAVVQTGNDIIAELNDPNFRNVLGPAMGRTSTLRDFIGNPPPEFSRLAGQIESFSLANMGVHGMRSSIGADKIKKLLDAHHTPESLVQAILGLTDFSNHFIENTGRSVQDNNSTTADGGGWTDLGNGVRIRKKK